MNKNLTLAKKITEKLGLPMKVFSVEENEEGILTFHFSSSSPLELHNLIKKLQEETKRRVVMREVNPRDEAKFFATIGPCGRKLCCASFLKSIPAIPVDTPKNTKGEDGKTGLCGKLMCCLAFEDKEIPPQKEVKKLLPEEKLEEPSKENQELPKTPKRRILRVLPRKKARHRR